MNFIKLPENHRKIMMIKIDIFSTLLKFVYQQQKPKSTRPQSMISHFLAFQRHSLIIYDDKKQIFYYNYS